jgi:hypothetical protein
MELGVLIGLAFFMGIPALTLWFWVKAIEDLEEQYTNDDR